ncbi:aminomethyltransferase [Alteribacillus persepolensis]|uniref:Aminomethyltransferase n=1 Tax=Alteribacillus persepolensis TaxID=568899 RepID=A0A1G8GX40_9BACI|nr:glycine cleavage system aminomethyltransferase GcvT [Alteribacillus persepolensis]SDH98899.1 aminomethyltransferase [Alteribacillus persepolensis]
MGTKTNLQRTPLFPVYEKYGAKVIDFGGWEMPVQFSGIMEEHNAVRQQAGLFDVSHMGEVIVKGRDATQYLNYLVTNDISSLRVHQAQYTAMCYPDGGTVDDLVIYRLEEEAYLLVLNAANIEKDVDWIKKNAKGEVDIENVSDETALIAIQGPNAESILQALTDTDLSSIRFFHFLPQAAISDIGHVLVSRTGYTGEDGFELYVKADKAADLWEKILQAGEGKGLVPCGLGARDTLRLEACLLLYGQDLSPDISPVEAGIGFVVKTNKDNDFIGKDSLTQQKDQGAAKKLAGIEVTGKGIPRQGYQVFSEDEKEIGYITSGTHSPTFKKGIGLALIEADYAKPGTVLKVKVRKKFVETVVVKKPFYKRKS